MGFCSLLWIVLSDQKNQKYTWYIFKEIVQLRSGKREGMCPTENQLAKILKSWVGDSRACSDVNDLQFRCNEVVSSVVVESKIEKN